MFSFLCNALATAAMYTRLDRIPGVERFIVDLCERHCTGQHRNHPTQIPFLSEFVEMFKMGEDRGTDGK